MAQSFKPGNITKEESRALQKLAVGMALTYGAANVTQKNLTGNYMWDNPPGKEFEIVFPVGDPKDKRYLSTPLMPGFTAVPRRIASGAMAAAKGDFKEAAGQFSGLLSIPAGMAGELIRNKDYFGNDIIGENQIGDAALYLGKKMLPGYGRAIVDVASGKATPAFGAMEAMELPVRKGTFPNPYFTAQKKELEKLPAELSQQAEYLTTSDKKGGPDSATEAKMMLGDERLLQYKKNIALASNPNDALYSRPDEDVKAFLAYRIAEDPQQKAQIVLKYPWIPQVQFANSEQMYNSQQERMNPSPNYDPNSLSGKLGEYLNPGKPVDPNATTFDKPKASPKQQLTQEQVMVASAYTAAPKESATRKQLLAKNPWLKTYWDANSKFYEENPFEAKGPLADYLTSIGIDPNSASGSSGFGGYAKKGKKLAIRKIPQSKVSVAKIKFKPVRMAKATKADLSPSKRRKVAKIKIKRLSDGKTKSQAYYSGLVV